MLCFDSISFFKSLSVSLSHPILISLRSIQYATNCPCDKLFLRRIVCNELSMRRIIRATNSPQRIVRDELSGDELSGHQDFYLSFNVRQQVLRG